MSADIVKTAHQMAAIQEAQNFGRALEIIAEETIHQRGGILSDLVHERVPEVRNYVVLVLTEDEAEAVSFMTLELIERVHKIARLHSDELAS